MATLLTINSRTKESGSSGGGDRGGTDKDKGQRLTRRITYQSDNESNHFGYRLGDFGTQPLPKAVKAAAFDAEQQNLAGDALRIEAGADGQGLADSDAVTADRTRRCLGQLLPAQAMDGAGNPAELYGIDNHQQLLAIQFLEEIDTAQPEKDQAHRFCKMVLAESLVDGPTHSVIGNQLVADADDQGAPSHG